MGQNCGRGDGGGCEARGEGGFVLMAGPPGAKMNVSGIADVHKRQHRSGAGALAEVAGCSVATLV